jgi:ankyrin repeat protein
MRIVALMSVAVLTACDVGPLPAAAPHPDIRRKATGFPSNSDEPFRLDSAIRTNQLHLLKSFLEAGDNPNLRWGRTGDHFPLQEVFDTGGYELSGHSDYVLALLTHGADPNMRWCPYESRGTWDGPGKCTSEGGTFALAWAAAFGSADIVEMLLAAGAEPSMQDWTGSSALDYAADDVTFETIARGQFPELATRDRHSLAWVSGRRRAAYGSERPQNATPVLRAMTGNPAVVYSPLPPPSLDAHGEHWPSAGAVERKVMLRLRPILRIGVDPNERAGWPDHDWAGLGLALAQKQYSAARLLLDAGANVNQRWCELFRSDYFRDQGPTDLRCTFENGVTPLMWAAASGDEQAVELLLEYAADVTLKNWMGQSAADVARTDSIRRLLEGRSSTAARQQSR